MIPSKHTTIKNLDIVTYAFNDKIFVNIHSKGAYTRTYYVPLRLSPGNQFFAHTEYDDDGEDISNLPLTHLTPMSLVGGSNADTLGQIIAVQVASQVVKDSPTEVRTVFVSIGRVNQEDYDDVLEGVKLCRVW